MSDSSSPVSRPVRVWDLPVRVCHWGLAAAFAAAWLTQGDDRRLDVHVFAGYVFLGLLGFRLVWGLAGSRYARFAEFVRGPRAVGGYLARLFTSRRQAYVGHNPAGGWAVLSLLGLGGGVALSGLLALGAEERHGPLAGILDFAWGERLHALHGILAWAMLGLVGIHLAGVAVESLLHRENLVRAMLGGYKPLSGAAASVPRHALLGSLLLLAVLAAAGGYFRGYAQATPERPYLPFAGPALAQDAEWQAVCGECHLAFHPSLLPARSWQRLFAEQAEHFGDDLALDGAALGRLAAFAATQAAGTPPTEAAWKLTRGVPADAAPLRITDTRYWRDKHAALDDAVWTHPAVGGKAACAACHLDAEQGTFEDAAMRLPAQ